MAHIFFQLGSTPSLSLEEIQSVFSVPIEGHSGFCFLETPSQYAKKRFYEMGGVQRAGKVEGEGSDISAITAQITQYLQKKSVSGKKMKVGLGFASKSGWKKWGIDMQKQIKSFAKEAEFSVRIVNRKPINLDSFAVEKEKLLDKGNAEIFCIPVSSGWCWGTIFAVQNSADFALRDMQKPVRDMQVGMLPPKLARIMINLARDSKGNLPQKIYDPFCGTGTVLLEALSLQCKIAGSDIAAKMVHATQKNTQWYYDIIHTSTAINDERDPFFLRDIFVKDATKPFTPPQQKKIAGSTVVCEGFLGKIFHKPVSIQEYTQQKEILFPLYRQFLFCMAKEKCSRIVFGFPFWKGEKTEYSFVPELITFAQKIGWKAEKKPIRYLREKQVVGREIVVFAKK